MEEKKNIIELPEIQRTKVGIEINDQNIFLVSVPSSALKWLVNKVTNFFVKK